MRPCSAETTQGYAVAAPVGSNGEQGEELRSCEYCWCSRRRLPTT